MKPLPDKLNEFIENETWTFAKTYAKTWPHEYLVRDRVDKDLFLQLVSHIRDHGYQGTFFSKPITYFDESGMVYWTMGAPVEETTIINRCLKEQSYEYKRDHGQVPDQQVQEAHEKDDAHPVAQMLWYPAEISEVQFICALRFAGYEYEERVLSKIGDGSANNMPDLNRPVIDSLALYGDNLKNFTVFLPCNAFSSSGEGSGSQNTVRSISPSTSYSCTCTSRPSLKRSYIKATSISGMRSPPNALSQQPPL